jgi:hypothetical protein
LRLALEWHRLLSIYLPGRSQSMLDSLLLCPSDDADMTVAIEHRQQHVMYFGDVAVESQVLEDVMLAQAIAVRCASSNEKRFQICDRSRHLFSRDVRRSP